MAASAPKDAGNHLVDLIGNAYEFLESALENLEGNPKSSVIDFYTAVELFLKAPLLNEHWSLIVTKDPDIRKFKSGDFSSTNFEETVKRLNSTLETEISQDAKKAFDTVRKHRNQFVHFHKNGQAGSIEKIAVEQFKAWAHLHHLITSRFVDVFLPYTVRTETIERKLKRHQEFWDAHVQLRFEEIKPYLEKERASGANVIQCDKCRVSSLVLRTICGAFQEGGCKICHESHRELAIACPSCNDPLTLINDGHSSCGECGAPITPDILYGITDTSAKFHPPGDVVEFLVPASCENCDGYETICEYHDHYLCTSCLIMNDSLSVCGYCSTPTNSANQDTYAFGCAFCDGAVGNMKDD